MDETFKCPHCGALYEITYEKTDADDNHAADSQVCGKRMDLSIGADQHTETVKPSCHLAS